MNFVTYAQLARDVTALGGRLPLDTIGVLGVPRSGMLAANILSTTRHLHLGDVSTFARTGEFLFPGRRLLSAGPERFRGTIVVVDDSHYRGRAMGNARAELERSPWWPHHKWIFAAVYAAEDVPDGVDLWHSVVPQPRLFEWNFMQRSDLQDALCDIDGVLCHDPPQGLENEGDDMYREFIQNAVPLYRPWYKIGGLVTMRLDRWREDTEAWLESQGIRYKRLTMCPSRTAARRRQTMDYGQFKSKCLRGGPYKWAIESSETQARAMAEFAKKPVVCIETMECYS